MDIKEFSNLIDDQELKQLNDVRFLVGKERSVFYANKGVLSCGSQVFKRMFTGQLKEGDEVVIPDLSAIGFSNALRYAHGCEIDYKPNTLYESYEAAEKYMLKNFNEKFVNHIRGIQAPMNLGLIYDQLFRIITYHSYNPLLSQLFDEITSLIARNSMEAFTSTEFTGIAEETLISLLSLEELTITEIDLLGAVAEWIDKGLQLNDNRATNTEKRREAFKPLKAYILFATLTPEQVSDPNSVVAELLTDEERGLLLLHLIDNRNPQPLEIRTSRRASFPSWSASPPRSLSAYSDDSLPEPGFEPV